MTLEGKTQFLIVASIILLYLVFVLIGRILRRHAGFPVGVSFRLLCLVSAVYLPLSLSGVDYKTSWFDLYRELGTAEALLGTIVGLGLLRRYFWEGYLGSRGVEIPRFLRDVVALLIFVVVGMVVLSVNYGYTPTSLIAGSGVMAIILGIAMQDLLGSIIAGVAIQIGKPFKGGDWLKVDTIYGEVVDINWRSTRLRTTDNVVLDIPNAQIVKGTVVNLTHPTPEHAMRLRIGIDYSAAPNQVKALLKKATLESVAVLPNPEPRVFLVEFADSAILYEIKYWMNDHARNAECADSIRTNIWYALQRAGIRIPFPIRTVQIERAATRPHSIDAFTRQTLCERPFFQCLPEAQVDRLLQTARLSSFGAREKIIEQGSPGDSMFILVDGAAEVLVSGNRVATLAAGDYFGEMSLLTGESRSATVVAQGDCQVLEIGKALFARILEENPGLMERLSEMLATRRMENEGILAANAGAAAAASKQSEYKAGFLKKLAAFFDL